MDRGYLDFTRLAYVGPARSVFVVRAKTNLKSRRLYSHPVDRSTGLTCDQTIVLTDPRSAEHYPDKLRGVRYGDDTRGEAWTYLPNDFELPALTVAHLHRSGWQVELRFR